MVAAPWRGAYVATKFALEGITDALRLELAGSGIAVVLVEPGPIATPFRRNAIPHFERHVDWRASPHRAAYENGLMRRLYAEDPARDRFELPPNAVSAVLVRALGGAVAGSALPRHGAGAGRLGAAPAAADPRPRRRAPRAVSR